MMHGQINIKFVQINVLTLDFKQPRDLYLYKINS